MKREVSCGILFLKKEISLKNLSRALILLIALMLLYGCGQTRKKGERRPLESFRPTHTVIDVNPEIEKYEIKTIAVLPFGIKRYAMIDSANREINYKITDMFQRQLALNTRFNLISQEEVKTIIDPYNIFSFNKERFSQGIFIMRNRGVDGVVMGEISRYSDRSGGAISVQKPASVAFEIFLFSLKDGSSLWSASFRRTQKPLSENAMEVGSFIKGGGTWQTGETMTRLAIEEIIREFPKPK